MPKKFLNLYLFTTILISMWVNGYANSFHTNVDFEIEKYLHQKFQSSHVGIIVLDPQFNTVIYEKNANENFYPASNTKLFTAAAALKYLSDQHQFNTSIHFDPNLFQPQNNSLDGDLIIVFRGDPTLKASDLQAMFKELASKGIKKIKGHVIIDDSLFQDPTFAEGWTIESQPWYYSAPISSIIINENKVDFELNVNNAKVKLRQLTKQLPNINIAHDLKIVSLEESKRDCQLKIHQDKFNNFTLGGCWPKERTPKTLSFSLGNPRELAKAVISSSLQDNNILVPNGIQFRKANNSYPAMVSRRSPPLKKMLPLVLAESNNVVTETLTKTLGLNYYGRAAFQTGTLALVNIIQNDFGIDLSHSHFSDGSGQSRYNFTSPYVITQLLNKIYHDKGFELFKLSLSQPGKPGQLSFRLKNKEFLNKIYAKTGSASGTSSLSGFILNQAGTKTYLFSVMINQSHLEYYPLKQAEDHLIELLWKKINQIASS